MSDFYIQQMMFLNEVVEGEWEVVGGEVVVTGNVDMSDKELTKIPYKFKYVSGYFDCSENKLTTLKNCPKEIGGQFKCSSNNLKNVKYISKIKRYVESDSYAIYNLKDNPLTTLQHIPKKIKMGCVYFDWSDDIYKYFNNNLDKVHFWNLIYNYIDLFHNLPQSINYISPNLERDDLKYYLENIPQLKLYYRN